MGVAGNGELHLVAFGRERYHGGAMCRLRCEHRRLFSSGLSTSMRVNQRHRYNLGDRCCWKLAHCRCNRRPRTEVCDDVLDVALALVTHLVQYVSVVGRRQVGCEERDGGECNRALRERIQHDRKPSCRPRRLDASVCRVLRELERPRAVSEERRAAVTEIQLSRIDMGEQGDEPYRWRAARFLRRTSPRRGVPNPTGGKRFPESSFLLITSSFSDTQNGPSAANDIRWPR